MRRTVAAIALTMAAPAFAQPNPHAGHGTQPARQPVQERHDHAQGEDQRAVLAVAERMLASLTAKDKAALLAEVVPEGRATASVMEPSRRVMSIAWPAFADHLAQIPGRPVERLIEPHVHVAGDIAMIWSRYEFEIDGRFTHCGIDHFDLVRQDGRWRVLNLTWTQQTQGCPGR